MAPLFADGTFFISSQDPDLDISFGQLGNGFWNPVLKFVFDSSRSDQLDNGTETLLDVTPSTKLVTQPVQPVRNICFAHQEVLLDLLVHPVQDLLPVGHGHLGIFVFPGPGSKLVRADVFVAQAQRPQGGVGKFLEHKRESVVPFGR